MNEAEVTAAARSPHVWDRWDLAWHGLFYLTLVLPTVTALAGLRPLASLLVALALSLALAAWHWLLVLRRPAWRSRGGLVLVWFVGAAGLVLALVGLHGDYSFTVLGLYPLAFALLGRWRVPAVVALTALARWRSGALRGASDEPAVFLRFAGSAAFSVAIGLFIEAIARQSAQRQAAIEQLEAARAGLSAAAAENARLLAEAEARSRAGLALGLARTPEEALAAVGEHLAGDATSGLALVAGARGEVVAEWRRAGPLGGASPTLRLALPGGAEPLSVLAWSAEAPPAAVADRLGAIAPQLALTLENLRLAERARLAGVLEERQRLAGELHDTLAQGFTGIVLQLEAAEPALERDRETARRHLARARDAARACLAEARRSVQALRPTALEGRSLPEALRGAAAAWSAATGVAARVATTGHATPLPAEVELALLRAAQEALANVAKHAKASWVDLTLSYMADLVVLDVADDGCGMEHPLAGGDGDGGFGLAVLRQRLARVGGELLVESGVGEGTTLVARVALAP